MMSPQRNKEEAGSYVFDKKYEILIYLPTRKWKLNMFVNTSYYRLREKMFYMIKTRNLEVTFFKEKSYKRS